MAGENLEKRRARDRARHHRRKAERAAAGLCLKCGKRPPLPGRKTCGVCAGKERDRIARRVAAGYRKNRSKEKATRAALHAERRAAGVCVKCGAPPEKPGASLCKRHAEAERARFRRQYAARRAAGLCTECGKPTEDGHWLCPAHAEERRRRDRERHAARVAKGLPGRSGSLVRARERSQERAAKRYASRKAAGLCTSCGKVPAAPGRTQCEGCAAHSRRLDRQARAERRARGQCRDCDRAAVPGKAYCAEHLAARRGMKRDGAAAERDRKRRLYWERRAAGVCVTCGEPSGGATYCAKHAAERQRAKAHRVAVACTNPDDLAAPFWRDGDGDHA